MDLTGLPGAELVARGLSELSRGEETAASLLVSVGSPRLRLLGIQVPPEIPGAEERLYRLLARDGADAAHGRYNALVRSLVSFERSLALRSRAA
ncbi:hypothetical protein FBQ97_03490 [Acidobacteria bacterium ACD]|nr:MAG: hypothetical protein EDX89_11440 [Acidobacteriota bacterium]MCE7957268.1 hypothetical protein [Acidobacteria bacterium ACB2]MDL1948860.1 hypothetical protein [Acidobacteria bacterium ACD]